MLAQQRKVAFARRMGKENLVDAYMAGYRNALERFVSEKRDMTLADDIAREAAAKYHTKLTL